MRLKSGCPPYGTIPKQGCRSAKASSIIIKNDGLQNQSVLYRQKGLNGAPEVFLDPNKLSATGTTALGSMSFSKDNRYAAYLLASAGSDWQQAFVMDVATKT